MSTAWSFQNETAAKSHNQLGNLIEMQQLTETRNRASVGKKIKTDEFYACICNSQNWTGNSKAADQPWRTFQSPAIAYLGAKRQKQSKCTITVDCNICWFEGWVFSIDVRQRKWTLNLEGYFYVLLNIWTRQPFSCKPYIASGRRYLYFTESRVEEERNTRRNKEW